MLPLKTNVHFYNRFYLIKCHRHNLKYYFCSIGTSSTRKTTNNIYCGFLGYEQRLLLLLST